MKRNLTAASTAALALLTAVAFYSPQPAALANGPTPINNLPKTITAPGTHCVTGNLTPPLGQFGILVQCDDVIIDLAGFRLTGPGPGYNVSAIEGQGRNLEVRNGAIDGRTG